MTNLASLTFVLVTNWVTITNPVECLGPCCVDLRTNALVQVGEEKTNVVCVLTNAGKIYTNTVDSVPPKTVKATFERKIDRALVEQDGTIKVLSTKITAAKAVEP